MGFTFVNGWGGKILKRWFHDTRKLYEIQISTSINKVALAHRHTHPFTCYLWLPHGYNDRVKQCGLQSKIFAIWPSTGNVCRSQSKSLLDVNKNQKPPTSFSAWASLWSLVLFLDSLWHWKPTHIIAHGILRLSPPSSSTWTLSCGLKFPSNEHVAW